MKRILVVEDDPVNAKMLADYLAAHGYETSVARTGPEGLECFQAAPPDLALIDVLLPRKNGFELCFDIKRTLEGQRTPVLLMTAVYRDLRHGEQYAKESLAADGFLLKPFELSELLYRVRVLLGEIESTEK